MQINLLFFGITADISGKSQLPLEISPDETVGSLRKKLREKFEKLNEFNNYAIAVNMEYAEDDVQLKNNDTVALIPPVSGG